MRLLFVAAIPMEYRGILARAEGVEKIDLAVDFARRARLAGHEVLLVANGMGPHRAAAAIDAAEGFRPDAMVNTGFCGAVEESLGIADIVAATAVTSEGKRHAARPLDAPHHGVIWSIDHVAQTAAEKRKLRDAGACAVDMEAGAVAVKAEVRGLPFYCVRAVTDLAGETMATDFNRALRSDGHLDTIDILRGVLCHPASRIPELLRLASRSLRAAEALGEFFVGCRF